MNNADEHLLKALVLAPTLLNDIDVPSNLPKCLFFEACYKEKTRMLPRDQYATSYEVAQIILEMSYHAVGDKRVETVRLGNQILNIMRSNGRRVP